LHVLVIARWRGSPHDSRIWNNIKEQFENGILLSDSGYACTPYIMLTPILNPQNYVERQYNCTHIRARNTIEKLFGQIKQRFRCLLRGMTIRPSSHGDTERNCNCLDTRRLGD